MNDTQYNRAMTGEQPGIWRWSDRLPEVDPAYHLTLGEGETPLQEVEGIYFKREDLNPSGSVKDRGLAFQFSYYAALGHRSFVISSSGNAAISAAMFAEKYGFELTAFVSDTVDEQKLQMLIAASVNVKQEARAVTAAVRFAKIHGIVNLRPGTDEWGSIGYQTLGYELEQQLGGAIGSMFFPVSSGTTLVGAANGFVEKPPLMVVQGSRIHPVASKLGSMGEDEESSLATGLVARYVPRMEQILALVQETEGRGVIVNNQEIEAAFEWLEKRYLPVSYDASTVLAGYMKAKNEGVSIQEPVVILLTGRRR